MAFKDKGRLLARGLSFGASWPAVGLATRAIAPHKSPSFTPLPPTGNRKERRGRAKRGEP